MLADIVNGIMHSKINVEFKNSWFGSGAITVYSVDIMGSLVFGWMCLTPAMAMDVLSSNSISTEKGEAHTPLITLISVLRQMIGAGTGCFSLPHQQQARTNALTL